MFKTEIDKNKCYTNTVQNTFRTIIRRGKNVKFLRLGFFFIFFEKIPAVLYNDITIVIFPSNFIPDIHLICSNRTIHFLYFKFFFSLLDLNCDLFCWALKNAFFYFLLPIPKIVFRKKSESNLDLWNKATSAKHPMYICLPKSYYKSSIQTNSLDPTRALTFKLADPIEL